MKKTLVSLVAAASMAVSAAAIEFITIGTGGVTGVYYPTGGAICRLANQERAKTGIRCTVESTGGSVYNVNNIDAGELDFGIAQSDVVYQAHQGEGNFKGKKIDKLRTVMTFHAEPLTFVVSKESGIKSLQDMKDKVINIGNPGSGQRNMLEMLFRETDLDISMLKGAEELKAAEMPRALRDGKIDGYFYTVGHPSANIKEAANAIDIDIVNITEQTQPGIDTIIKKMPYYAIGIIPDGSYDGVEGDRHTLGVKATLVTSADVSDEKVRAVLDAIMKDFKKFTGMHPAYRGLTKQSTLEGLGAPLHPAAKAYFEEKGLLK